MEHVNFDRVNAIMMRGEKGPEHGIFWEKQAELECYSQCIMRLEGNEFMWRANERDFEEYKDRINPEQNCKK